MRAVRKLHPGRGAELVKVPVPVAKPGELLLKVRVASLCGTDYHIFQWDTWAQNRFTPPRTMGHEMCGEVVALGAGVDDFGPGDLVSVETHVVCGRCMLCRTGQGHICEHYEIMGVDRDGAWADYVALPAANAWKLPPGVKTEIGSIQEPFGNTVHTVMSGEIAGLSVLILGAGPLGLMAAALCKKLGAAQTIISDVNPYRLAKARAMGADHALAADTLRAEATRLTDGHGVDVVLEMSGHPEAIVDGLTLARHGARVSLLGIPSEPLCLDLGELVVLKGLTLQGITGRLMMKTWMQTGAFLASGLDLSPVISHRLPLESFAEAMELVQSGEASKVALYVSEPIPHQ